jgi:hypothetical protein
LEYWPLNKKNMKMIRSAVLALPSHFPPNHNFCKIVTSSFSKISMPTHRLPDQSLLNLITAPSSIPSSSDSHP